MITLKTGPSAVVPEGILVGNAQDRIAATGCTAILCPQGAVGAVAVRGAAPATRETDLLAPENTVHSVHAVVLSGGSAYGLDAAGGVVRYLEEQKSGFEFSGFVVPVVVGASLFDLDIGSAACRPNAQMGYLAADCASPNITETGNVGAGTGASVGRFLGPSCAMKGGLGVASVESGSLQVTALVAVNSLGNVADRDTGTYLAGARMNKDGKDSIVEPLDVLPDLLGGMVNERTNTTIGAILTNADLHKSEAQRVASMAHDGLARAIYPAHTSFDGDALFTLATGRVWAHQDVVGALAALAVEQAVLNAVRSARDAYGLPAASSFEGEHPLV
ncbi:MAG: P1 family peptidase [Coriobacteriales bacterium]|jgi:L-aminopeptidase/D-esterase-like protein|nr:P1 family peptidase [Coriobacteriales bacterium]